MLRTIGSQKQIKMLSSRSILLKFPTNIRTTYYRMKTPRPQFISKMSEIPFTNTLILMSNIFLFNYDQLTFAMSNMSTTDHTRGVLHAIS